MSDIEIWQLTELGSRAARNPSNPTEPAYKIISFLDFMGTATTAQIVDHVSGFFPDVDPGEISMDVRKLARIGIVERANKRVDTSIA
jgi:hypothetical protein